MKSQRFGSSEARKIRFDSDWEILFLPTTQEMARQPSPQGEIGMTEKRICGRQSLVDYIHDLHDTAVTTPQSHARVSTQGRENRKAQTAHVPAGEEVNVRALTDLLDDWLGQSLTHDEQRGGARKRTEKGQMARQAAD